MRSSVIRQNRVSIDKKDVLKYIGYFIAFLLLANGKLENGIAPFGLGLFVALVFCKESIVALSPVYVLAIVAVSPSLEGFVSACMPPLTIGIAVGAHQLLKKQLTLLPINIYAFISQIPLLVLTLSQSGSISLAVLNLVLSQVFTYCCVVICYAVLVRGLRYKFSADEVACLFILIMAIALGLAGLDIYGFKPYLLFSGFLIIFSVYMFEAKTAYVLCFVWGLGGSISGGNLSTAGAMLLMALVASVFIKSNVYYAGVSVVLCDVILGLLFNAYASFDYLHIIALSLGVSLFLLFSKKYRNLIKTKISSISSNVLVKNYVLRMREETYERLKECGKIYEEMCAVMQGEEKSLPSILTTKKALSQDIARCVCVDCHRREECFKSLGGDTSGVFEKLIDAVVEKEKVSMIDAPTYLTSRCCRVNAVLSKANDLSSQYKVFKQKGKDLSLGREIVAYQMQGVANMMDKFADDIKTNVSFDSEREERIIEELSFHNIIASEALVYIDKEGEVEASVLVRRKDSAKKALQGVLSKLLKTELERVAERKNERGELVEVRFKTRRKYSLVFGEASLKKTDSDKSGDTHSFVKINDDSFMFAICDGMGSGDEAYSSSEKTIAMVESFYRADFGGESALNLTNRLLSLQEEERFSALDLSVVDTKRGVLDMLKLGGVESFLMRGDGVEVLHTNALPMGILDEVRPHIERKILMHGDMLIMISDGILETMSQENIADFIKKNRTLNPQIMAQNLLLKATAGGNIAKDDSSVLCFRVSENRVA